MDDSKPTSARGELPSDQQGAVKHVRASDPVCALLEAAVRHSGRTRKEIGVSSAIHKDALRRILVGERSPTLVEAKRILEACETSAQGTLLLCLLGDRAQGEDWIQGPVAEFLELFLAELPLALENVLGHQLFDIRPRWAKGAAHRVAHLISDHINEMEKRDGQAFWV